MTSALGVPEIDELWRAIDYEVTWLHGRWTIYRQLYGTSPDRVDVLNKAAGTFAAMLQDVLLEDVQLGLAKLGDPAASRVGRETFENLTLRTLSEKVIATGALVAELPLLIGAYDSACVKIKERRNKRIAHFDLNTMLKKSEASLPGPSRAEIESALDALRKFMNCISLHFTGNNVAYEEVILNSDGDSLISVLKKGLRYRELVRAGEITHDDLRKSTTSPHSE